MIVLGVADADHVVGRQTKLAERLGEAGRLAQARRQHHHGVFVERHMQLEPEITDDLKDAGLVGLPGRNDHPANRNRGNPALPQRADERFGRRLAKELFLALCRPSSGLLRIDTEHICPAFELECHVLVQ